MLEFSQPLTTIPINGYNPKGLKILSWAPYDSNNGNKHYVMHSTTRYANHIVSQPLHDILNMVRRDLFNESQKTM